MERLSHYMGVRISASMEKALRSLAHAHSIRYSNMIRLCLFDGCRKYAPQLDIDIKAWEHRWYQEHKGGLRCCTAYELLERMDALVKYVGEEAAGKHV